MHGGKVRWLSMAFESVSPFIFQLFIFQQHISTSLSVGAVPKALPLLLSQDHIQGEVLLSDLLRLPAVGELHPGAARLAPAVLRSAAGFPDLRALEADLHGNHRRVKLCFFPPSKLNRD